MSLKQPGIWYLYLFSCYNISWLSLTLSAWQTKTDTIANSDDPDEMVCDQDLHCLSFCFWFLTDLLICISKYKAGRVHIRNSWVKGLTLLLLNTTWPVLSNSVDPDQLASSEANWSGSALFVIKYVNFYQKLWSSNLIGWKLEVGRAS